MKRGAGIRKGKSGKPSPSQRNLGGVSTPCEYDNRRRTKSFGNPASRGGFQLMGTQPRSVSSVTLIISNVGYMCNV